MLLPDCRPKPKQNARGKSSQKMHLTPIASLLEHLSWPGLAHTSASLFARRSLKTLPGNARTLSFPVRPFLSLCMLFDFQLPIPCWHFAQVSFSRCSSLQYWTLGQCIWGNVYGALYIAVTLLHTAFCTATMIVPACAWVQTSPHMKTCHGPVLELQKLAVGFI